MSDTKNRLADALEAIIGGKGFLDHDGVADQLLELFNITDKVSTENMVLPIEGQTLRWVELHHNSSTNEPDRGTVLTTDKAEANVINSDVLNSWNAEHKIILDIDFPVHVVESSEGKSHLYIDYAVSWDQVVMLMSVLVELGLLERGYMYASIDRGFTSVRVPWALKNSGYNVPEPNKTDN